MILESWLFIIDDGLLICFQKHIYIFISGLIG